MKGENGMKKMFNAISGIGFVSTLIGCGAMDSASPIIPIAIICVGITLCAFGSRMGELYG